MKYYVFLFHLAMTCCVAINAKEGDCWIVLSLMSHKCHINHQILSTELRRLARQRIILNELTRSSKEMWQK